MKSTKPLCTAIIAAMALSCTQEPEAPESLNGGIEMEFTASWAQEEESKTVLQENGTDIWWTTKEDIDVFYGNRFSGVFTSTNTEPTSIATFRGTLNVIAGSIEDEDGQPKFWAIYPYCENNSCDGQSVTLSLPYYQIGSSGTFADRFFPAVACGTTPNFAFYNICGGARFSVVTEGVRRVVFRSNDGSPMAGTARISFGEDKRPIIQTVSEAIDSVVITAPPGGFTPGGNYFAAILPQEYEKGFMITLYTASQRASKTINKSITIKRSAFGILNSVDNGIVYEDCGNWRAPFPDDIIEFEDDRIKSHCIAAFDTNGDGKLSYAEAAAVKDVSTAFTSKLYTSFEEFRYFTGITEIPAEWFKDRARLETIALPAGVRSVGNKAFSGCGALEKIAVGGTLISTTTIQTVFPDSYSIVKDCEILHSDDNYSICGNAFLNCSGLSSLTLPEGLSTIGRSAFQGCIGLTSLTLPEGLSTIETSTFQGCTGLTSLTLPEGLSTIGTSAFQGCTSLASLTLPEGLSTIGRSAFQDCTNIEEASFPGSLQFIGTNSFYRCTRLRRINIPSLENWISIQYADAASAPFYSSREGHLYISGTEIKVAVLPQSITDLGQYTFYYCTGIEELTLPSGLANVHSNAFYGCKSLKKANIATLASWMGITFENQGAAPFNASGEGHLFVGGKELKEPLIQEEITAFSDYAFHNCTGFTKMTLEPTVPPSLGSRALDGTRCYFIVRDERLNSYKSSWSSWAARIISEKALLGEEWVDLGLSVKWGICNLGAVSETDYGLYYAWGETIPKSDYNWSNYLWCNGSEHSINKYYDGDGKYLLDIEDDAAVFALGGKWRIPTSSEWRELEENCTWKWTTLGGIYGRKVTSLKEGYTNQWIFLPAAGYREGTSLNYAGSVGRYWSSSTVASSYADGVLFDSNYVYWGGISYSRYYGQSIRPVCDK